MSHYQQSRMNSFEKVKYQITNFFQQHANSNLFIMLLASLAFVFTFGLSSIIHSFGLLNPISKTYRLISEYVSNATHETASSSSSSPSPSTSRRQQQKSSQHNNNYGINQEQTQQYLKFWLVYILSLFLTTILKPVLNIFIPASFVINLFFIVLLSRPIDMGVFLFDNVIGDILSSNISIFESLVSSTDKISHSLYQRLTTVVPEFILYVANALKPIFESVQTLQQSTTSTTTNNTKSTSPTIEDDSSQSLFSQSKISQPHHVHHHPQQQPQHHQKKHTKHDDSHLNNDDDQKVETE